MIKSRLSHYLVVSKLFNTSSCVDVTQNGFLDVWVVEELMFQFEFILRRDGRMWIVAPLVRLSHDKPWNMFASSTVVLEEVF